MKQKLLYYLFVAMLLSSCSNLKTDKTLVFLPGTYVRSELREFGQINDTITIKVHHSEVNSFVIEQRWRYDRILDGVPQEPEYKVIKDLGMYNSSKKLLQNQRNLRIYSFDERKKVLYYGISVFQKIK
ncbi:hypothetical protein [Lacibacter sp.]|uniref:hypothetical protein n=1 Tax=Lacibacter sp. TaxID=1915409 RepID=UPI002B4AC51E|nr:hypothetical protein [Lacibacter sp.]HLP37764.1 hypothetical protein [Lacibacter sp.]